MEKSSPEGRRGFLRVLLASPLALMAVRAWDLIAADSAPLAAPAGAGQRLPPTPECGDDDEPTPAETEGPFFKPRSPERTSLLEPKMAGTQIEVTGRVFGRDCRPLAGVLLDFWQADDAGEYDHEGFRLRGHQYTDAEGRYRLATVVPGHYPGRTRHIHVKVQPRGGKILTTQLYFPDEPRNRRDGLFQPELLVAMDRERAPGRAHFHFVLDVG